MARLGPSRFACAAALSAFAIMAAPNAQAAPITTVFPGGIVCLPPPNPNNGYVAQFHNHYATGGPVFDLTNLIHRAFTTCTPVPTAGNSVTDTFSSTLDFDLSTNGGAAVHHSVPGAQTSVIVTNAGSVGSTTTYSTQMIQLDLNLGGGVLIRESPTLQSNGQTQITNSGGGIFQIDSFFDVFTELSIDNGASWTPSTSVNGGGPIANHVALAVVPEPATLSILGLSLFGLAAARRRCRRG